jgi:hypothetical protein
MRSMTRVQFIARAGIILFDITPRAQPTSYQLNRGGSSPVVRWLACESEHYSPCKAKVKICGTLPSLTYNVVNKHGDNI